LAGEGVTSGYAIPSFLSGHSWRRGWGTPLRCSRLNRSATLSVLWFGARNVM
jgi:hypothetical protein